ncbi:hypothetical protein LIA77_05295 [Sarocladium implicatum]|nr:hypothetical protein LIA77_05295 [Sarocladium implicatum]
MGYHTPPPQSASGIDSSQREHLHPQSPGHSSGWHDNVSPVSNEEEYRAYPVPERISETLGSKGQSDSGAETTQSLTVPVDVAIDPSRSQKSLSIFTLAADATSVILPLALLGFLIVVILLDSEETTDVSFAKWDNATTVLATVFPIVFATIVGRLTYEICRWKLEKGSTVGSLEQLLGSRTFGGTILTQVHLRGVNALGIGLIIFWSFSPLGAQSLLRILSTEWAPISKANSVVYQNTEMTQGLSLVPTPDLIAAGGGQPMEGEYQAIFQYLGRRLSALILAPESLQSNYVDLWGNFKVPFLEEDDNDGWQETTSTPERETWTSLAGLPLANLLHGNSTFSVETSYLDVRCDNITTVINRPETDGKDLSSGLVELYRDVVAQAWPDEDSLESGYETKKFRNGSWHGISMGDQTFDSARWSIATDRFVDPYWTNHSVQSGRAGVPDMPTLDDITAEGMAASYKFGTFFNSPELLRNETGIDAGRARLLIQTEGAREFPEVGKSSRTVMMCDIHQRYVESQVLCQQPRLQTSGSDSNNCSVTRQRRSRQQHASENITHLSFPNAFWRFTRDLPKATFMGYSGRYDLLHAYLREPNQMGPLTSSLSQAPALWEYEWPDKDNVAISRRLTQILNTYLLLSSSNQQEIMTDTYYGSIRPNSTTTAETTNLVLRYKVSKLWSILGIVSCAAFLAGGIASVVFTHMASGPEVLGYVSTVMRDSKILGLHPSVGHMSALDIKSQYYLARHDRWAGYLANEYPITRRVTRLQQEPGKAAQVPENVRYDISSGTKRLVVVVFGSDPGPALCKVMMSAIAMGYPMPVVVNWGKHIEDYFPAYIRETHLEHVGPHLMKIVGALEYLDEVSHMTAHKDDRLEEDDLVLMVDAYDVWFQTPPEVLISRYHEQNREARQRFLKEWPGREKDMPMDQSIIISSQKKCFPASEDGYDVKCAEVPDSPLRADLYGSMTDSSPRLFEKESTRHHNVRPKYINSGAIIGPVGALRKFMRRSKDRMDEKVLNDERRFKSDQGMMGEIWGEQEVYRTWLRDNAEKSNNQTNGFELGNDNFEYGVGLDYKQEICIPTVFAEEDGDILELDNKTFIKSRSQKLGIRPTRLQGLPKDLANSPNPLELLPKVKDVLGWEHMPVYADFFTASVPAMVHHNAHHGGLKNRNHLWWDRMWYFPYLRDLVTTRLESTTLKPLGQVTARDGNKAVYYPVRGDKWKRLPRIFRSGKGLKGLGMGEWDDLCFNSGNPDEHWTVEVMRDGKGPLRAGRHGSDET